MSRILSFTILAVAALPLAAQFASVPPQDRLQLAVQLSKRGMHAEALREYEAIRGAKGVPHDEVLFRLGETYKALKRPQNALDCYAELLRSAPASRYADVARLNRAMLRSGKERMKELKELNRPDAPESIRAAVLYHLGDLANESKDVKGAVEYYRLAAAVSPTNEIAPLASIKGAMLLSASADPADRQQAMVAYLDLACSKKPKVVEEALFSAAMLAYRDAHYDKAAPLFRRLASEFPGGARAKESRIFFAWSCYLSGRYAEALEIASPLRSPSDEDAYYITASSLRMLERRADALNAYDAQLKAFPKGRYADEAWFDRLAVTAAQGDNAGVIAQVKAKADPPAKYADRAWSLACESAIALTNYSAAVEYALQASRNRNGEHAAGAMHRLAWLYERTGDWIHAARAYRDLAGTWPDNPVAAQALYTAGACELKLGRIEQACNDWKALLVRHPESPYAPDALYARAIAILRRPKKTVKDYRAAEQLLGERLARFPKAGRRMECLYWRGIAAHNAGDDPEAEKHLRAALAEKPSAVFEREIKLELASVLKKRGAKAEAAALFVSVLGTKAEDRLTPEVLEWTARAMADARKWAEARAAAAVLERRNVSKAWTQIAATIVGQAHESLGENDAAKAAYARALATGAATEDGARSALALGRLETDGGQFDEARAHLEDAVARAQSQDQLPLRVRAYAALAENEEVRGKMEKALGYHMLVGSLFNDDRLVPHALLRSAEILVDMGRDKEAAGIRAELRKRFPNAPEAHERKTDR